jgi:hypothetical protein
MIVKMLFAIFFAFLCKMAVCQYTDVYRAESSMDEFHLVSEKIVPKSEQLIAMLKDRNYRIAGYKDSLLIIQLSCTNQIYNSSQPSKSQQACELVFYNEGKREITLIEKIDTVETKAYEINICQSRIVKLGYFPIPKNMEKIDITSYVIKNDYDPNIWSENNGIPHQISKIYAEYMHNPITYYIDNTCNKVLISQYCENIYWCTERDSLLFIYDLDKIQKGNNIPDTLSCVYCLNPQVVGDTLYYSQGFEAYPETGGLEYHLYKSPINDLSKKELISEYVVMRYISDDGRYIIGQKDLNKFTFVLIDTRAKKFDYLIGRDYYIKREPIFYSQIYNQFVVDYKDYFIYINVPDKFLLNSTGRDAKKIDNSEIRDKVEQMKHKELK